MKKVIVFKMENMMVRDFDRKESVERNVRKVENRLRERIGLDVLEEELRERKYLERLKNQLEKGRKEMEEGKVKEKDMKKKRENLEKNEKRIGELEEKWGKKVLGKEEWMELEEKIRVKREEMNKLWDKDEVEREMRGKVLRLENEFYGREFENSKLKRGMDEILGVLRVLRERCGLEIFVVSKYVNNVKGILCRNGCDDLKVVNFRGDWVEEILKETGRGRNEVILFSNEGEDVSMSEVWGIKVEGFDVREGKKEEFLKKIGIKKEKKEEKENRKRLN